MTANLATVLETAATRFSDRVAVVQNDKSYTYRELYDTAGQIAAALGPCQVGKGDKVGLLCPNGAEYIAAFYGILMTGATVVPVSTELKPAEVLDLCEQMALDAYFFAVQTPPPAGFAAAAQPLTILGDKAMACAPALRRNPDAPERALLAQVGAANIRFTSGTTSRSKGVILSHDTILRRAAATGHNFGFTEQDCILWMLSMAHHFVATITPILMNGAKIVVGETMNPGALGEWVRQHGITRTFGSPLSYKMMINQESLTPADLAPVRHIFSTATYLPGAVSAAFRQRFEREIVQAYGLIEVGIPFVNMSEDEAKRGSVGCLGQGYEVRLDPVDIEVDQPGEVGEILIRGDGLFDGYYQPWQPREQILDQGWFRTGDIARKDADGYYWIVGRNKEIINVGGIKVFPSEIEKLLLTHPEVEEAMVYPVEDARFGEVPHAKVRLAAGATCAPRDLIRLTSERLSVFKALRAVEVVDEIPKTSTGKVRRYQK